MNTQKGLSWLSFSRVISPVYSLITQTCKRCPISSCRVISRVVQEALIHRTVRKKNVHKNCFSSCNSTCITFADWFQTCSVASGFSMSLGEGEEDRDGNSSRSLRRGKKGGLQKKEQESSFLSGCVVGQGFAWGSSVTPAALGFHSASAVTSPNSLRALQNQSHLYKTDTWNSHVNKICKLGTTILKQISWQSEQTFSFPQKLSVGQQTTQDMLSNENSQTT